MFEQLSPIEAIACFERAVGIDPTFALAHAWIGVTNMLAANLNVLPSLTAYPRGRAAAERALTLDPQVVVGNIAGAAYSLWFEWDQQRGEVFARKAVAIAPGLGMTHEFVAWATLMAGHFDEAIAAAERAYSVDPLSDFILLNVALIYHFAGHNAPAIELLQPAIARSPSHGTLHVRLGYALFAENRLPEARAALERGHELTSVSNWAPAGLSCVLAALGEIEGARRMLDEARDLAERGRGSAWEVAIAYHWIGDDDAAYEWLERALLAHEHWLAYMHLEPRLRRLRGTPRFEAMIRRIGVSPSSSS